MLKSGVEMIIGVNHEPYFEKEGERIEKKYIFRKKERIHRDRIYDLRAYRRSHETEGANV